MSTKKDYFNELIESIKDSCLSEINVLYVAKISKITPPTATVQPLAMINGKKQNEVHRVHFLATNGKIDYQKGDNVVIGCFDTDNALFNNKSFYISSDIRKHSVDFSIILGRYAKRSDFKGGE